MQLIFKSSILAMGLISVLGLSACQSTAQPTHPDAKALPDRSSKHHHQDREKRFEGKHHNARYSEERRQKFEQRRAERKARHEALQKACESNAGKTITVKIGEQTYNGSCQVYFQPDPKMSKKPVQGQTTPAQP